VCQSGIDCLNLALTVLCVALTVLCVFGRRTRSRAYHLPRSTALFSSRCAPAPAFRCPICSRVKAIGPPQICDHIYSRVKAFSLPHLQEGKGYSTAPTTPFTIWYWVFAPLPLTRWTIGAVAQPHPPPKLSDMHKVANLWVLRNSVHPRE